jgi:hypothetical protein
MNPSSPYPICSFARGRVSGVGPILRSSVTWRSARRGRYSNFITDVGLWDTSIPCCSLVMLQSLYLWYNQYLLRQKQGSRRGNVLSSYLSVIGCFTSFLSRSHSRKTGSALKPLPRDDCFNKVFFTQRNADSTGFPPKKRIEASIVL